MPRIPMRDAATTDMRVPRVDVPQGPSQSGMALARVGEQVSNFALDIMQKRKAAQDNDYAFSTYAQDFKDLSEYELELKKNTPEDGSGYKDSMSAWVQNRFKENLKRAPSREAEELYKRRFDQLALNAEVEASNYENVQRAKHWASNMDKNVNNLGVAFFNRPDAKKAYEVITNIKDDIAQNIGIHFDEATANELKVKQGKSIGMALLDGLDHNENYAAAVALLKDTTGDGKVLNDFTSEERGQMLRRFEGALQTKAAEVNAEARAYAQDVIFSNLSGQAVDPKNVDRAINMVVTSGMKGPAQTRLIDELKISKAVNDELITMMKTPINQWADPEEVVKMRSDGFNARSRAQAAEALARAQVVAKKMAVEDSASYALQASSELRMMGQLTPNSPPQMFQAYAEKTKAVSESLGIPHRILTNAQAKQKAMEIQGAKNANEAAFIVEDLKSKYGKWAPQVIAESVEKGDLEVEYLLLGHFSGDATGGLATRQMVETIKNKKEINEAFKTNINAYKESDVKSNVAEGLSAYMGSIQSKYPDPSRLKFSNAIQNQVELEVKKEITNGNKLDSDLVEKAVNRVIGSHYDAIEVNNSAFLVPKKSASGAINNPREIEYFVKAYSRRDGFKAMNLPVPDKFKEGYVQPKTRSLLGTNNDPESRYLAFLEDNAFWDLTPDGQSLSLYVMNDGIKTIVPDANNRQIRKSLQEISTMPDDLQLAEGQSWKMFRSNKAKAKAK